MEPLQDAVRNWAPDPVVRTACIDTEPLGAFAALLDQPAPATGDGDPVPLGWHWFSFLDRPTTAELGPDGHPRDGHFLPPLPSRRRMFAGGRLTSTAPLRVGAEISRTTTLVRTEAKQARSGALLFVTVRSDFREAGELLLTEEQDLVYRSEPPAAAGPAAPAPATPAPATELPAPGGESTVDLLPEPALLFRFSALTYNAHRIHYDLPYATGVEGHPGLVVHGPLLALLLLEVPRRHLPGRSVRELSYRLTRPAHAGTPVRATGRATGRPGDDRLELSAAAAGAAPSITGTAVLGEERTPW